LEGDRDRLKAIVKPVAIPLLLFVAATLTACGGGSADISVLATAAADATPASSFNVVAEDIEFDTDTLVVVAGREVVIDFENRDGAMHNIAVFTEKGGDVIYRGELFTGDDRREYRFQAPPAGVYYFHCDAHPEMEGVFIAR
jgi:plastocyanin